MQVYSKQVQERINAFLSAQIASLEDYAPALKEAMAYGLLLGGKRSRPFLVYATGKIYGIAEDLLDYAAAAVECIHAYSLIHDDMPEMDNDSLRRGQATVHIKYGPAMALLAGDALQSLAYELLSDQHFKLPDACKLRLVRLLSQRAGFKGMCGGQAIDLLSENTTIELPRLQHLHSLKTGALIEASILLGAHCQAQLESEHYKALQQYASFTGLAFQVWDDVLDIIGNVAKIGKSVGADQALGKSTYPALLGLEQAKNYAQELSHKAIASLAPLALDTSLLQDFARFAVTRDH